MLETLEEPPTATGYVTSHNTGFTAPTEVARELPDDRRREVVPDRDREYASKLPKYDFPRFSGTNPDTDSQITRNRPDRAVLIQHDT